MCLSYQYDLPQGYSGKLALGTILQPWGPCFDSNLVEITQLKTIIKNNHYTSYCLAIVSATSGETHSVVKLFLLL